MPLWGLPAGEETSVARSLSEAWGRPPDARLTLGRVAREGSGV
jgi:hypothetical protein